jgi:endogenous inhibitor of DNA gyrase (YacG/DUF329 family)
LILNWPVVKEKNVRRDDRQLPDLRQNRGLGRAEPFRPFCSKRCQLIDLGEWAAEEKRIPSASDLSDSDDWSEEQPVTGLTRNSG